MTRVQFVLVSAAACPAGCELRYAPVYRVHLN